MMSELCFVMAQAGTPSFLSSVWSVLLLVLGFSLVIFVHELGHFLAAKWAGVRVDQFAIGFGRALISYRRGLGVRAGSTAQECEQRIEAYLSEKQITEPTDRDRNEAARALGLSETEYRFNWMPLGGYVKMLGQEDFVVDKSGELKVKDNPDSFINKSVGKRMVIISAGVIMNLLFAAVAFAVVVMVGRYENPSIVGFVKDNSPAGRAGLQIGDRIAAVNGKPLDSFRELLMAIVLADPDEPLVLDVYRDGKLLEPKPRVMPEYQADEKVRQIGVGGAMNRRVMFPSLSTAEPTSAHELRTNDLIARLAGTPEGERTDLGRLHRALITARGRPVSVIVQRPDDPEVLSADALMSADADVPSKEVDVQLQALWAPLAYDSGDTVSGSLLGLVPRVTVLSVELGKSFELAGVAPGDVIVRAGNHAYPTYAELKKTIEEHEGQPVAVEVRRPRAANGDLSAAVVGFCVEHREDILRAAVASAEAARTLLAARLEESALSMEERTGLVAKVEGLASATEWRRLLERVDVHTLKPLVPRKPFALFDRSAAPTLDAMLRCVDENHLVVADVNEKLGERESPAKAAGIPRGAVILSAAGRPVRMWYELCEVFRENAGRTIAVEFRLVDEIYTRDFTVPGSVTAALDIPADARIVQVDNRTSYAVAGAKGDQEVALPDWRALAGILRAAKGRTVTVEYMVDGERRTGAYAVLQTNADPWLQRVRYAPTFVCYPLRERHAVRNPVLAVGIGFRQAYDATMHTIQTIRHMVFTRQVGVSKVSGPVGIVRHGTQIAEQSALDLLWFLAVISANLAVINFLPMPIVDGGLFLFLVLEKIRGEPVSIRTQVATQLIGIALIATLFILVTYNDVKNWILGT